MDTYIHIDTQQYPFTLDQVRSYLCHLSLPVTPTAAQLAKHGFAHISPTPRPEGYEVLEQPPQCLDGTYFQRWKVVKKHSVPQLKENIKQTNERFYQRFLAAGFAIDADRALLLTDDTELSYGLLECLLLKDTGEADDVSLALRDGSYLVLPWQDALTILRQAVKAKQRLNRAHKACRQRLHSVKTIDDYQRLEQTLLLEEELTCWK